MKKMMKFAAMAVAAIAMLVSCEEETPLTVDGKQWIVVCDYDSPTQPGVIDLGFTEAGKISFGLQDLESNEWTEIGWLDMGLPYTIQDNGDGTGVISYTYSWQGVEYVERIKYSQLTDTTVKFDEYIIIDAEGNEDNSESSLFWCIDYTKEAKVADAPITINTLF